MSLKAYAWQSVRARPGRTTLTLAGIAIGIAAMVGVTLTSDTANHAYGDMFERVAGRAALEVVSDGLQGVEGSWVEKLADVPGVRATSPAVQMPGALLLPDGGRLLVLVLGVDPILDAAVHQMTVTRSAMNSGPAETPLDFAWLDEGFAAARGIALGTSIRVLAPSGVATFRVVGLMAPGAASAFSGGAVVYVVLPAAQRLFALSDRVTTVQLVLKDGADRAEVERAVKARLPAGLRIQQPASRGAISSDSMAAVRLSLSAVSAMSLVAGAFIILNAFLMNLTERRRSLALLRALGATRRQVTRMLLAEVLVLSLAGTALGVVAGIGIAEALTRGLESLYVIQFPRLAPALGTIGPALALGPGMALLAVIGPARRAANRDPLDGLLEDRSSASESVAGWTVRVGIALVIASLLVELGLSQGWLPPAALTTGIGSMMVGCVLALPLLIPPLTRFARACLKPLFGAEGRLALDHVDRHGARTSLTVGVLFVAVIVALGMGNSIWNRIRDLHGWADRTLVEDFFVRSVIPETGTSLAATVPEAMGDEIGALPGVLRVQRLRFIPARVEGQPVVLLAKSFSRDVPLPLDLMEGDRASALEALHRGEVVLGIVPAHRLGKGVGDEVVIDARDGPNRLRVAGVSNEYTVGGSAIYLEWETAKRLFGFEGADVFMVDARPGERATAETAIRELGAKNGLLVHSNLEFRAVIDHMTEGVVGLMWALLALVFVVASLGIVNTLTMNVLEKTRELGLLRAVAMTRRQVKKMILTEALAMGLVGGIPGVTAGVVLAWMINMVIGPLEDHPVPFHVLPALVVGCFVASLLTAVLSAFLPARRAARLQIVEALQYE